ncbi:hypothetical protein CSOJ01_13801 [Colletotrichum sojae]|uniref:DUF7872 domain-containing protein n=1 Tax=Colletotrichum sojae TaxID=2175907 RepID=A0A8H6IS94_9PEZI|nr:hypothetical protein CSOJ01_13801 [Colletotrichum sojae]
MRLVAVITALGIPMAFSSPLPQSSGSDKTCATEVLTADTWKKLGMDNWLLAYSQNMTQGTSNNVQLFASSFGAPNFFCGLDSFCNAGQPCLPVPLPAWYALVAMQNWNSYMNSINTAITFASSIISLILPEIVTDFYPKPADNVTPMKDAIRMFNTVLGAVPLTGALGTASSAITGGLSFLSGQMKVPTGKDQFLAWTQISSTMATVVQEYQAAVAASVQETLDANLAQAVGGMYVTLLDGQFLGVHRNVTQQDIQDSVIDTFKIRAAALALQAQKMFIYRVSGMPWCSGDSAAFRCAQDGDKWGSYSLLQLDGNGNGVIQNDVVDLLVNKYGLKQEDVLIVPTACYDKNGKKQLVDGFGDSLPLDPKAECLFMVPTCDATISSSGIAYPEADGYEDRCGQQGISL